MPNFEIAEMLNAKFRQVKKQQQRFTIKNFTHWLLIIISVISA